MREGSNMTDLAVVAHELQEHLTAKTGTVFLPKESSKEMKLIATGMDLGGLFIDGIPAGKVFMEDFATTLMKDACIPLSIRNNPLALIEVSTHESEHGLQWDDTGVEFAWFYLTDPVACAQFETDGYASGISTRCWLTGQGPAESIPWVLDNLVKSYRLKLVSRPYAETALKSHFASVSSGIYMTRSGKIATDFLQEKYPWLKGTIR
jgi:hypothetical protein